MTVNDLIFIACVFVLLALVVRLVMQAIHQRYRALRRTAVMIAAFIGVYAALLIGIALTAKRQFIPPGEPKCFDDWCVAALQAERVEGNRWVATLEVSSVAKRVTQRASDAEVELEDRDGTRYHPSAEAKDKRLTDSLAPGESFLVEVPFLLPAEAEPAGLIISHGAFPGRIIIGDTQSFLHPRILFKIVGHDLSRNEIYAAWTSSSPQDKPRPACYSSSSTSPTRAALAAATILSACNPGT